MPILRIFPDAGTGNTTVDGQVTHFTGITEGDPFATLQASGTEANGTNTQIAVYLWNRYGNTNTWYNYLIRGIFTYDTSPLTSGANISAVTFALMPKTIFSELGMTGDDIDQAIVSSNPASDNELVTADYDTLGSTEFSDARLDHSAAIVDTYLTQTLNAAGIAAISKTGITKLGIQLGVDFDDGTPPWLGNSVRDGILWYSADEAGTDSDPYIEITYTLPSTFIPKITIT